MGTVYRAVDQSLDRRVALKVLHAGLADDPSLVARFDKEARIMARLEHPNLVPVYAVDVHEGVPYIVMKLLEGSTLAAVWRARGRKPFTAPELVPMIDQLCAGLAYMHDQ